MLSLSLITLGLAAVGAYAKPPVHAIGGLEISLSTPTNKVASVSDLKITATVKNDGDEDLKILKFGTVLDNESHSRAFIVSKDGKEVPFASTTVCVPSFPTFALSSIFTLTGSHRFRPPRSTSPRTTGLSYQPARVLLPSTMVRFQVSIYVRDLG